MYNINMKITIDIPEDELKQLGWSWPPVQFPQKQNTNQQWWPNDAYEYDPCKDCSNNPKNGGSGVCHCTLPYMYGPRRITCTTASLSNSATKDWEIR